MHKVKILHCADVHLGSEMMSLPRISHERKVEHLKAFRKIVNLCREEKVEILLIAGDLFEGSNVDSKTVQSVQEYLGSIDCPVFISPGNHDYIALDSPYMDAGWPSNVKIFKGEMERVVLEEKKVAVYGAAFNGTYVKQSMLRFKEVDPSYINLLCIHGEVVSQGQSSVYHGIYLNQFRDSQMDYIALGHIHKREEIKRIGDTFYSYSGCPEGTGFDELGSKGVYLGDIYKGHHTLEYYEVCQRQYIRMDIDMSDVIRELEAELKIKDTLKSQFSNDYTKHIYQLRLVGESEPSDTLPIKTIEANLSDSIYHIELFDKRTIKHDYESLREEVSLKGIFTRNMLSLIEEATMKNNQSLVETYQKALNYGMMAFEGQEMTHED